MIISVKLYTKKGDQGQTGILSNQRVLKNNPILEAYGDVDELSAILGLAQTKNCPPALETHLKRIQSELLVLGTELASLDMEEKQRKKLPQLNEEMISQLEQEIDQMDAELEPLTNFILPGGAASACHLHMARTVCRRAERRTVVLREKLENRPSILPYLNRLSDWLFVAARWSNLKAGERDHLWNAS